MHPNIPPGPPGVLNNGYPPQGPPGHYYNQQHQQMLPPQGAPLNHVPMNPQNIQNSMYNPGPYSAGPPHGHPVPPPNAHMMHWMNNEYPSYSNSPAPSYAPSMVSDMSHRSIQDDRHSTMSIQSDMRINEGRPSSQISCSENVDPRSSQPIMNLNDLLANFLNPAVRADVIRSLDFACNEARAKRLMLPCAQLLPLLEKALEDFSISDISKMTRSIIYFIGNANKEELVHEITKKNRKDNKNFVILLAKNAVKTLELIYALNQLLKMGEDILIMARNTYVLDSLMSKLLTIDQLNHVHYYRYTLQCLTLLVKDKASKTKSYVLDPTRSDSIGAVDIILKVIIPKVSQIIGMPKLPGTGKSPTSVGVDIINDTYELLLHILSPNDRSDQERAKEDAVKRILPNEGIMVLLQSLTWYASKIPPTKRHLLTRTLKFLNTVASSDRFFQYAREIDDNKARRIVEMTSMLMEITTSKTQNQGIDIPIWRYLLGFIYLFTFKNERNKLFFVEQRGFAVLAFAINKCSFEIGCYREQKNNPQNVDNRKLESQRSNLNEALENAIITLMGLAFLRHSQTHQIFSIMEAALFDVNFLESILRVYDGSLDQITEPYVVKRLPKLISRLIDTLRGYSSPEFVLKTLTQLVHMNGTASNTSNSPWDVNLIGILVMETSRQLEALFNPMQELKENQKSEYEESIVRNLSCLCRLIDFCTLDVKHNILRLAGDSKLHCHFLRLVESDFKANSVEFSRNVLFFGNEISSFNPQYAQIWASEIKSLAELTLRMDDKTAKAAQHIMEKLNPSMDNNDPLTSAVLGFQIQSEY